MRRPRTAAWRSRDTFTLRTRPDVVAASAGLVPPCLVLSASELVDLVRIHLADLLDQVEDYNLWHYRPYAFYEMAEIVGLLGASSANYSADAALARDFAEIYARAPSSGSIAAAETTSKKRKR